MDTGHHLSLLLQCHGDSNRPPKEAIRGCTSLMVPEATAHCHSRWQHRQSRDICSPIAQSHVDESSVRRGLSAEGYEGGSRSVGCTHCAMLRPLFVGYLVGCSRGKLSSISAALLLTDLLLSRTCVRLSKFIRLII